MLCTCFISYSFSVIFSSFLHFFLWDSNIIEIVFCRFKVNWLFSSHTCTHFISLFTRVSSSSIFYNSYCISSCVGSLAQGDSGLRNKVSKSKHSLSDCFGKLIVASMHVFWSCWESFLIFQLRFQTAGYLACVTEIAPVSHGLLLMKFF